MTDGGVQPATTEAAATTSQEPAAFAKRRNRGNIRRRAAEDVEAAGEDASTVVRKAKAAKEDPLSFSTRQKTAEKVEPFKYESSRTLQQQTDQGATAQLETETQFDRDARALREQVLAQGTKGVEELASGTYQGMNNYVDYRKGFRREHTVGNEKGSGQHGPLRASTAVRSSVRFDYQPDICKDYKETGYCGYGDSCKFVHDRSDYKSGWELERQWDEQQKAKRQKVLEGWDPDKETLTEEDSDDEKEELPFACYICRRPWAECQDPVVTRCKHYFCEQCALQHNAKSSKCFVCDQPTNGIFNVATDIQKKLEQDQHASGAPS